MAPGRIGSLEVRNRILMCPMGDNQATDGGYVTDQQVAYFEARARGGAGLLLVGSVGVTAPDGLSTPQQSAIADDSFLPGWTRMAERVHAHGARLALQLVHNGKNAVMDIVAGRPMLVPSIPKEPSADPLMSMLTPEEAGNMGTPAQVEGGKIRFQEMNRDDIARIADAYAGSAERARRAGVDGVEIHAGHGYLIDNFLSPTTNRRDDEYGGSVENRARFLVETLDAIRARVGREFPVWCRINGEEYFIDGEKIQDACRVAQLAEAAGADAIHVSAYADPARAIGYTEAHSTHTPGRFVGHAAAVKQKVGIPVIAVGRIEPDHAERILADGSADFVAMGRKLIADPELPNKLAAGTPEEVRPCMYHYRCISQIFASSSVKCAVNAFTGRESELQLTPAENPRRILVVGGGPGGMEAARLAALRGHEVSLIEAQERLGGRFALAAHTAAPNAELLAWLEGQMERLPIDVALGQRANLDAIVRAGYDDVLVATGARFARNTLPGAEGARVHGVDELDDWLEGQGDWETRELVVIGGDRMGLSLAMVARRRGAEVTVLETSDVFAAANGLVGRWRYVHEAEAQGIHLCGGSEVLSIDREGVRWRDHIGYAQDTPADRVFITTGAEPDTSLASAIVSRGMRSHTIGDCREVALVEGAMRDAAEVVLAL
jgi:2,4-dienoyl-CoA reductase (NADPH2)